MRHPLTRFVVLTLGTLLVSCGGERSVLVSPLPGDSNPTLGAIPGPERAKIRPLERASGLGNDISWSFDAGPEGVFVRHPSTGLTVSIPQGALSAPTRITVTALAGNAVAYRFEPHGLQFASPVQLSQSLRGIKVKRDALGFPRLVGGYFPEDTLPTDPATHLAQVVELLPVWLDDGGKSARIEVRHFSGYTVASAAHEPVDGHR